MRVLFLAPWFRTLAHVWAEALRDAGHEVLVVTKPAHYEPRPPSPQEVLLTGRPRQPSGWSELRRVRPIVQRFDPDVVVAEEMRDLRLTALATNRPTVLMVHDAEPHDWTHRVPWQRRMVQRVMQPRVVAVVTFSQSVAAQVRSRSNTIPVHVAPLPSEMPDDMVPALVPADERRDFVLVGRLRPYKNISVVFDAWRAFKLGAPHNSDRLIVLGHGDLGVRPPLGVEQRLGRYTFTRAAPVVAAAKASVSYYTRGSQSGSQIWSMQVGCAAIVSDAGGLPEYQIPDIPCPSPDDVDALITLFARLSDPAEAFRLGLESQSDYRRRHSAGVSAAELLRILSAIV